MATPTVITETQEVKTWLQKHERLLIVFMILAVIAFGYNKYINYAAVRDHDAAQVSAQVLAQKEAQVAVLSNQVSQDKVAYAQAQATATAAIQSANTAIAQLKVALAQQKQADKTMPLPDLAQRWTGLVGLQPNDILAVPGGVQVTESGSRATVQALDEGVEVKKELDNEKQIVYSDNNTITACNKALSDNTALISGMKAEEVAVNNKCEADKKELKDEARKAKKNWFLRGAGIGGTIVAVLFLHGI